MKRFSYARESNGESSMGFFLYDFMSGKTGGAIVYNPELYAPSCNGYLVYLNREPDLKIVLDKS
jgi:hypothetical protein